MTGLSFAIWRDELSKRVMNFHHSDDIQQNMWTFITIKNYYDSLSLRVSTRLWLFIIVILAIQKIYISGEINEYSLRNPTFLLTIFNTKIPWMKLLIIHFNEQFSFYIWSFIIMENFHLRKINVHHNNELQEYWRNFISEMIFHHHEESSY